MDSVCPDCRQPLPNRPFVADLMRCEGCYRLLRQRPKPVAPVRPASAAAYGVATELSAAAVPKDTSSLVIELKVVEGPDRGRVYCADGNEIVLGRMAGHIALSDSKVSRQHLVLQQRGDQCIVRDLGSSNGTFINGLRVAEAVVQPGQSLAVGDTVLEVLRIDGTHPTR